MPYTHNKIQDRALLNIRREGLFFRGFVAGIENENKNKMRENFV
jgi:hypothetical protein